MDKKAYETEWQAKLDDLYGRADGLKDRAGKAAPEQKAEFDRHLGGLEENRARLGRHWDQVRQAGDQEWKDASQGMEKAYGDMEAALDKALVIFR